MAPRPLLLLLLLLLLLPLAGPAAPAPELGQLPRLRGAPAPGRARRPPPRAPRHSDGTLTSELSRLRDRARLQRLLQGLLGKRSLQDSKPGPASWSRPCPKWPHCPPAGLEAPRATPGPRLINPAASWARGWGLGFGAGRRQD